MIKRSRIYRLTVDDVLGPDREDVRDFTDRAIALDAFNFCARGLTHSVRLQEVTEAGTTTLQYWEHALSSTHED